MKSITVSVPFLGMALLTFHWAQVGMQDSARDSKIAIPPLTALPSATGVLEGHAVDYQARGQDEQIALILTNSGRIIPFGCLPAHHDQLNCIYPDDTVEAAAKRWPATILYLPIPSYKYLNGQIRMPNGLAPTIVAGKPKNIVVEAYYSENSQKHYLLKYADSVNRLRSRDYTFIFTYLFSAFYTIMWAMSSFTIYHYTLKRPAKAAAN